MHSVSFLRLHFRYGGFWAIERATTETMELLFFHGFLHRFLGQHSPTMTTRIGVSHSFSTWICAVRDGQVEVHFLIRSWSNLRASKHGADIFISSSFGWVPLVLRKLKFEKPFAMEMKCQNSNPS